MRPSPDFDNGDFQVYTKDGGRKLDYFMFGEEYSFSLDTLIGLMTFLLSKEKKFFSESDEESSSKLDSSVG